MIIIYGQFLSFPCIWKLIVISGHQLKEPQASWFVNDLMYSYHYVQNCNHFKRLNFIYLMEMLKESYYIQFERKPAVKRNRFPYSKVQSAGCQPSVFVSLVAKSPGQHFSAAAMRAPPPPRPAPKTIIQPKTNLVVVIITSTCH